MRNLYFILIVLKAFVLLFVRLYEYDPIILPQQEVAAAEDKNMAEKGQEIIKTEEENNEEKIVTEKMQEKDPLKKGEKDLWKEEINRVELSENKKREQSESEVKTRVEQLLTQKLTSKKKYINNPNNY